MLLQSRFIPIILFIFISQISLAEKNICANIFPPDIGNSNLNFTESDQKITHAKLTSHATQKILEVPEFVYIREVAKKMGLRVWLFGGTASSYAHYVMWDLARENGIAPLQPDRFDYDFTNIFRSTQDLDLVVDGTPEQALDFQKTIAKRFPFFAGSKDHKWEVRSLRHRKGLPGGTGFKEALLDDADFAKQNSDSHSVGMIELTSSHEPVVRDLRSWNQVDSIFFEDVLKNRISFFRSPDHNLTSRAKLGENPEILSVIRVLVKAFQYELELSPQQLSSLQEIIDAFEPRLEGLNTVALRKIQETSVKLIFHAVNLEYAINTLDQLGLRKKLIALGNKNEVSNFAWWLNKEPLRTKLIGMGTKKTAVELGINEVAHETNSYQAWESIVRSHTGSPNILISRDNTPGEGAGSGEGLYTQRGRIGAKWTGLTIRFKVNPNARVGTDFTISGDTVVFQNKSVLTLVRESLDLSLEQLVRIAENGEEISFDHSDLALLETFKRKINAVQILDELKVLMESPKAEDQNRLVTIMTSFHRYALQKILPPKILAEVVRTIYAKISPLFNSSNETEAVLYLRMTGAMLETLDSLQLLSYEQFISKTERIALRSGPAGTSGIESAKMEASIQHAISKWKVKLAQLMALSAVESRIQLEKFYFETMKDFFSVSQRNFTMDSFFSNSNSDHQMDLTVRREVMRLIADIPNIEAIHFNTAGKIESEVNPQEVPRYDFLETLPLIEMFSKFFENAKSPEERQRRVEEFLKWPQQGDFFKRKIYEILGDDFISGTAVAENLEAIFLARHLREKPGSESALKDLILIHPQTVLFIGPYPEAEKLLRPLLQAKSFQLRKEAFFTLSLLTKKMKWFETTLSEDEARKLMDEVVRWRGILSPPLSPKKNHFRHLYDKEPDFTKDFIRLLGSSDEAVLSKVLYGWRIFPSITAAGEQLDVFIPSSRSPDALNQQITRILSSASDFSLKRLAFYVLVHRNDDPIEILYHPSLTENEFTQLFKEFQSWSGPRGLEDSTAYKKFASRFFGGTDIDEIAIQIFKARQVQKSYKDISILIGILEKNPQVALYCLAFSWPDF